MVDGGGLVGGRYRLVRPLASGGMSCVWLATDERSGRPVAVKQTVPPADLDAWHRPLLGYWAALSAHALTRLIHPNVVRVLDVLRDEDGPWLVMEYVPCRSLLQVIDAGGPLSVAEAARIGVAVLDGLAAAERAGVLHLDVKPSNVLMADDGRILLADFGPAVTRETIEAMAATGMVLGSAPYVAPERLTGEPVTGRADLWSLGATLYHAVEGRPPFDRHDMATTLRAIQHDSPPPARRAGALGPLLKGLLRKDPALRMTATEAADQLRRVHERRGASSYRSRLPVAAAAAAVTLLLALAAVSAEGAAASHATPPRDPFAGSGQAAGSEFR